MPSPGFSLGTKMALAASVILSVVTILIASFFLTANLDLLERYGRPLFFCILTLLTVVFTSAVFVGLTRLFVDRPLRGLMQVVTEAPQRYFLGRATVTGSDVIARLAQSINRLLERITTLDAFKIETEGQLKTAQEVLQVREALEEKNRIIGETNRELEVRLKELSLLYDFSQKVSLTLELDELTNIVERFLGETLGFREFAFLVYEEEGQQLVVKVGHGFADESRIRGMSFRRGEGATGRALLKGETIYIPDTRQDPGYLYYKGEKREDGSFLAIPLVFKQKVVGVLNATRAGTYSFSSGEIQFLNTIAVELAIALVNARLYSKTRELSVRDELTQLYNRRYFQEILPLEIKRAHRFKKTLSLLMVDIDYFKKFNDRYGHLAGDRILREMVHLVASRTREVDFFARFGGEEFVLILPNTQKEDAAKVADKIRTLIHQHPFLAGNHQTAETLTVSIGVASWPDDAQSMEDLIDTADIALYHAKGEGRNRVSLYESQAKGTIQASS